MSLAIKKFNMLPSIKYSGLQKMAIHIPSEAHKKISENFLKITNSPYESKNFNDLSKKSTSILKSHLPCEVINAIQEVKDSEKGFLEITGIPQDPDLMDTPTDLKTIYQNKSTFISELFCMGISGLLKQEIYNFRQEGWGTGDLIFNIFPKPNMLSIKGAGGVEKDFRFHMENAWHSQTPDTLLLKGVRPDHEGEALTLAVANRAVYDALSPSEQTILRDSTFKIRPPEIHKRMEKEQGIILSEDSDYLGPIAVEESTGIKLMVNFNGMNPAEENEELIRVLKKTEDIAKELTYHVNLRDDNMLIVNNSRALHTRTGYTPRFDGKDRWFQRYFLAEQSKLWRFLGIGIQDFPFLSTEDAQELIKLLNNQKMINGQRLTNKFCPHKSNFVLNLPANLEEKKVEILKVLLRKGPAFPHRVV